ncbi:MAG TPA: class I SAM-dependent methyltransferase [Stellaceae bacterium]|nr:class I SAM-dependent methyltransferase [Stellaceae bacterium]
MRGFAATTSHGAVSAAALLCACSMNSMTAADPPAPTPADYAAILAAPDRSDADRKNDDRRHAAELLAFTGVRPGMKVLDMAADAGYSTELMARAVAPNGTVYGQNPPDNMARALTAFEARMKTPAMKDAVDDRRAFDDPVPPDVKNLDLVTFFFGYHDTTYLKVDRAKMDKAMFDALKPGGYLVVADYAALPGAPITTGKQFHRLDENIEKSELEAAGFKLVGEANFLRNPADTHDFIIFNSKIPIDSFVVKFQKPS